ncbi:unnamed protein product [Tuber melanosporum]|jgi:hypothetical protein|uniref:(Perigord truffle) hypothetical protein n=1 Tax=Tuber melanosporum (strain Mel28) TaxID=656061 RepID=D5G418_TUBMM|nr:uncharacterized protein GSTUM_00003907001 [Tuber melanosporum]CAZ79261.1 unnamed protein product [Tuber melanosporum]
MSQNDKDPPNADYNTQADGFKFVHEGLSIVTPGQAKTQDTVTVPSSAENAAGREIKEQVPRKKRLSFGGGNDGRGSPMFASLESARAKRMADGYDDQKPPDGFLGATFKRFISARPGNTLSGGK